MTAQAIGIFGLALCTILSGTGSAIGLKNTGSAANGVLAEDPSLFSKVLILVLLPATQGLYGLLISFMGLSKIAGLAGAEAGAGWSLFFAVLPMAIMGLISALMQAKTSVSSIQAVAKHPELSGKVMMFPAMVETYALLALVVSILLLNNI